MLGYRAGRVWAAKIDDGQGQEPAGVKNNGGVYVMSIVPAELQARPARTIPSGALPFRASAEAAGVQLLRLRAHERASAIAARACTSTREQPVTRELDPEHPLMGPHPTD